MSSPRFSRSSSIVVSVLSVVILLAVVITYEVAIVPSDQSEIQVSITAADLVRLSDNASAISLTALNLGQKAVSLSATLDNGSFLIPDGRFSRPTIVEGQTSAFDAKVANVANFSGVNGSIAVPNSRAFNSSTLSIEVAFQYAGYTPNNQMIIGKGSAGGNSFYLFSYRSLGIFNDFVMYVNNTRYDQQLGDIFAQSHWYDLVFTENGTEINAYVNGIMLGSWQRSITFQGNNDDLLIGSCICGGYNFNGSIALVRLYDRAITSSEVSWNYKNSGNPVTKSLALWLSLGQGRNGFFPDSSGQNNIGESSGGVAVVTPIQMGFDYVVTVIATSSNGSEYSTSKVMRAQQ